LNRAGGTLPKTSEGVPHLRVPMVIIREEVAMDPFCYAVSPGESNKYFQK